MKDDCLSKTLLLIALACSVSLAFAEPSFCKRPTRIAQADGAQGIGSITPEKIRGVVEMNLRQKWKPTSAADGARAIVHFSIANSGQLSGSATVKAPSGTADFDNACVEAVNRVGPMPAFPSYMGVSEIPFVAVFHTGKKPWVELKLEEEMGNDAGGQQAAATPAAPPGPGQPAALSSTGQSGWTLPSGGSGTGQSGWTQASGRSGAGQSGWTQPSGATGTGQSGWTQPSGDATASQSGWTQPSGNSGADGSGFTQQGHEMPQQTGALGSLGGPQGQPAQQIAGKLPQQQQPAANPGQSPVKVSTPANKTPQKTAPAAATGKPPLQQPPAGGPQQNVPPMGSQPPQTDMTGSHDLSQRVVLLNNNAVVALNDNNYELAIKKLEEALKIDPTYQAAHANLAIAYNNFGLQLKNRPDEAIKVFHKALALDPRNDSTRTNLDTIIQYMGKNPKNFKDRLDLGNKALAQGDVIGAKIEFEAAIAIKPDPIVQEKLRALASGAPPQAVQQVGAQQGSAIAGQPQQPAKGGPGSPGPGTGKPPVAPPQVNAINHRLPPEKGDTGIGAQSGGMAQQLDTMYRNLKNLEVKTFGKPFEADDVLTRLSRLEQKLLGKPQQGKPMRRLDALLMLQ